jgi:ribosomal-protein-serine acetyltransferase
MNFENYSIRLLEVSDLDAYFDLIERNRKRLEDFFTGTVARTKTFEDTSVFLGELIARKEQKTYYPFIVIDNTTNEIAGFLDLKNIDWGIPKSEIGCYTDEKYAGTGITSKAFSVFVDHCFATYGFKKLFLRTHPKNTAAQKLAEKCGFEIEGTIRRDYKTTSGEIIDLLYYGRLG